MKEKITENDYLLINAYLDGELTTEQEKTFAIKMENPEFRAEIEQYKNFRIQTRIWFEEKTKSAKKVDLWKDINTQISHNSYTQGGILKELFNKINSKLKFEILSPTSAAFALSLLVFGVYFVSKNSDESVIALNQVNIDASENTVAKQGNQQLNANDNQLISNLGFDEMLLDSEVNQQLIKSLSVKLIEPESVFADNNGSSMRVTGADVQWIKSENPYRMLSNRSGKNPPVIWVASKR